VSRANVEIGRQSVLVDLVEALTYALFYEIYTLRDGKIVRMDEFTDRAEALEAAGAQE
jgi:hypothetical protein